MHRAEDAFIGEMLGAARLRERLEIDRAHEIRLHGALGELPRVEARAAGLLGAVQRIGHNKTLRMQIRRLTRLTDGHSKKWENHAAAMAFFIAYYNFCRVHSTIKMTPAQASGLTSETWSLEKLIAEAGRVQ